ncbi:MULTISPECIES: hypothetical protein [unclassified Luteococcus]|uniref:hypothetical protein n=1 Tax=unclassified Luteococcus TaxID=2639923 RepID=UPI00313EA96E
MATNRTVRSTTTGRYTESEQRKAAAILATLPGADKELWTKRSTGTGRFVTKSGSTDERVPKKVG